MIQRHIFDGEDQWKQGRRGLFTASQINRLLAKPTGGREISVGAQTYCKELISELIAPPAPDFYNSAMQRGNEVEPQAVLAYANSRGLDVNAKDFIYTSLGGYVFFTDVERNLGGTPDIILSDRICEIKCPDSKTHLEYLLIETAEELASFKPEYYAQMQLNMYLCERDTCDFISFDDRYYDSNNHLKVIEVPKDNDFLDRLFERVEKANNYLNTLKQKFKS